MDQCTTEQMRTATNNKQQKHQTRKLQT